MRKFYGCYMGSYKKNYRWQCKAFPSEKEATEFAIDATKENDEICFTILVESNPVVPNILQPLLLEHIISRNMCRVDIVDS